jgi:saccharopine dehydrogenase-like NADP-dependent oxidoreductase
MRVLVFGGAGAVCKETTRDLAIYRDFDEIVIADYHLDTANALVKDIGDPRLSTMFFDTNDYDSIVNLFPGHDVVVNGLPWKYDVPVTKACVEVDVNGIDVSTEEEQCDFHGTALEKDIIFSPFKGLRQQLSR